MVRLLKRMVVKLLSLFGIGIYRLPPVPSKPAFDPNSIASAIDFNSQRNADELWSNPEVVTFYLSAERENFYDELITLLLRNGVDCNDKDVADIGCGLGDVLLRISRSFQPRSLTGYDFSQAGLDIARSVLPNASFHRYDIYELDTENAFDVVLCIETLEHLLFPNKALEKLLAITRRPGTIVATTPNGRIDGFKGHINFWSPESWQVFVKPCCGSHIVETDVLSDGRKNFAIIRLD